TGRCPLLEPYHDRGRGRRGRRRGRGRDRATAVDDRRAEPTPDRTRFRREHRAHARRIAARAHAIAHRRRLTGPVHAASERGATSATPPPAALTGRRAPAAPRTH